MSKNNVVVNYMYNMIYQIMNILVPIISIPYISRVIGADGIGTNGYSYSFAVVFASLAMFGISNYGSKSIAYVRESKKECSNTFWSIWFLQLLTSIVSILIYYIIFIFNDLLDMKLIFVMQFPWVIASIFDISWFYIGVEDFKKTVTRNILVKIVGLFLIFLLVKSKSDLYIYILINSMSAFIGNITFWFFIFKYVDRPNLKKINIIPHVKGAFILLIPVLLIQVYTTIDRTIIGSLSNLTEVGYYDQSQKIARISLTFVTSLSIVLMPKIANLFANGDTLKIQKYLKKSLDFTIIFSVFIASLISSVSKHFVPIFFSDEFIVIIPYMMISSIIIIFISVGGVFSNQFTLPTGKNMEYTIPLLLAAIINVVLNILLVPKFGALGGVIAIVVTEFWVAILRMFLVRKYLDLRFLFKGSWVYFLAGLTSFSVTYYIANLLSGGLIAIIIESIISFSIFLFITMTIKNPIRDELMKILKNRRIEKK